MRILEFKGRVGAVRLVPSGGGAFEVSVGGEVLHSKLGTREFPDFDVLVREIKARL